VSGPHVGTSGWGYPSWQPGFYPPGLDRSAFLSFYAEHLDTVELNATKYRLPSEEQFRSWAAQVPDGFRFAVKAPDGVERRLATFEERVRCLGDRLGCVRVVVERPRDDGFLELLLGSADPAIRYASMIRAPEPAGRISGSGSFSTRTPSSTGSRRSLTRSRGQEPRRSRSSGTTTHPMRPGRRCESRHRGADCPRGAGDVDDGGATVDR